MKKVVKKLNNIKKNSKEDLASKGDIRQLGVMLENMQDSISFVAETVVNLSDKVNNMDKKFSSDVSIIKSDISDIKFELKEKVSRDEFIVLVKRVEKLESQQ